MTMTIPDAIALDWNTLKHLMKNGVTESYVRLRLSATLDGPVADELTALIQHLHDLAKQSESLAANLAAMQIALEVSNV